MSLYLDAMDTNKIKCYPEQILTMYRSTEKTKTEGNVSLWLQLSFHLLCFVFLFCDSYAITLHFLCLGETEKKLKIDKSTSLTDAPKSNVKQEAILRCASHKYQLPPSCHCRSEALEAKKTLIGSK